MDFFKNLLLHIELQIGSYDLHNLSLGFLIVGAFLLRSKVVSVLLSGVRSLNKTLVTNSVVKNFTKPLEFIVAAMIPLITMKFFPHYMFHADVRNILQTIVFLCGFWIVFRAADSYSGKLQGLYNSFDAQLSRELAKLITNVLKVVLGGLCAFTVMDLWGINMGAFLGGVGILSAAVAFASQDTIKNIFGSVAVLADHTFGVGDRIVIESIEGTVEDIGLRSTVIRKADQSLVIIPNGNIVNAPVTNLSRSDSRMVQFTVHFQYDSQTQAVQDFVRELKIFIGDYKWYYEREGAPALLVWVDQIHSEGIAVLVRFFIAQTDFESLCVAREETLLYVKNLADKLKLKFFSFETKSSFTKVRPEQ